MKATKVYPPSDSYAVVMNARPECIAMASRVALAAEIEMAGTRVARINPAHRYMHPRWSAAHQRALRACCTRFADLLGTVRLLRANRQY